MSDGTSRNPGPRGAEPPSAARASWQLWTLFWLLFALQVADLGSTYMALAAGAREGNVMLRSLIYTPGIIVTKAFALVFLAILILRSTRVGRPAPQRLLVGARVIAVIYLGIVANNVIVTLRLR